ncbi:sugar kinase [Deinococcus wulumuqiensis]|uniref:sugar kinase n=1 Tax=Deinococcus wulumuqiensis TaxID=980427 RepID=UPI00242D8193|nr:sugar kinase [Deinococcus wulumuqiensis]
MERALDLIAVGECMVELLADTPLGQATTLKRGFGGDVLNALVSAARAGSRCGFITRVGHDPFGPVLREAWRSEGIDISHAPLVEGENGVYFISLLPGGEREFTYRRAGSAASGLSPADIDLSYVASARMILLSGITQAISPSAQAATLRAAHLAREAGTQVAYDPNYRPKLWQPRGGVAAARAAFQEVLSLIDLLLPSFPADTEILGDVTNPETVVNALMAQNSDLRIALKCGANGVLLSQAGLVPADPVDKVVDTTGAGDAWNGAFLHGLLIGSGVLEAAHSAHRFAAHTIRYRGAIPLR